MRRVKEVREIDEARERITSFAAWLLTNRDISIAECVRQLEAFHMDAVNETKANLAKAISR